MESSPRLNLEPSAANVASTLTSPEDKAIETVLEKTLVNAPEPAAKVSFSVLDLPTSLTITGKEVIEKLNELLADAVPNGIESLNPKQYTPEATADRIVQGATAFFDLFAQQNPELEGEELVDAFMTEIESGIDEGFEDAIEILEGLGAFEIEGVREGISQTRALIDEKLLAYESQKREELGLDPLNVGDEVKEQISQEVLAQTGSQVLDTLA